MKRLLWSVLLVLSIVLSACGNGEEEVATCENTLAPIEVELSWSPNNISPGENVTFQLNLSHDNLPIADPQDVALEIWEHGNEDYHYLEEVSETDEAGVYTLDWEFPEEGVYYAYYHVTACEMHRMEKEQVIVGDPDVEQIEQEEDTVESMWGHH